MTNIVTSKNRNGTRMFGIIGLLGVIFILAVIFTQAMTSAAIAQSGDLQPVLDRLQRLERDIRTLNIQISRPGQGTGAGQPALVSGSPDTPQMGTAGIARIDARMAEMEEELRAGTGKVEDMTFQIQQINQRLEKLIADIDYRLSAIESARINQPTSAQPSAPRVNAATAPTGVQSSLPGASTPGVLGTLTETDLNARPPAAGGGQSVATAAVQPVAEPAPQRPVSVLPEGGPKERYKYAFSLLRKAEYERAEAAFTEFVNLYADDPLGGNARYWLGETHYVRGQYDKAATVFLAAYQDATKGVKAPDTLLKLGMSLSNLDKKTEACASFDRLLADFPEASPLILNKVKSERQKNACP